MPSRRRGTGPRSPRQAASGPPPAAGWLAGKVALVTGGASGIGRAVATRFVREGARVCVLDLDAAGLRRLAASARGQILPLEGDVRRPEGNERAVRRAVEAFGRLDIFVGNAGLFDGFVRLADLSGPALDRAFQELFDINVRAYLLGARAAAAELDRTRGAVIFTVSSAGLRAGAGGILYTATKHAVVGLVRQLAYELAPRVRVNGVAPGGTVTGMRTLESLRGFARAAPAPAQRAARIRRANPLGIAMRPEDHAAAYVLLASDQARAITGAIIPSDAGLDVRGLWRAGRLT